MEEKKKTGWEVLTTLPGILTGCATLITAVAGLLAALITAGVLSRHTPTPTPPVLPTPSPSANALQTVRITLTNFFCISQDFYVDNLLVVKALEPGASTTFQVTPGQHSTYVCKPGTDSCSSPTPINWATAASHSIFSSPDCKIDITLTNNFCKAQDFYVDDTLVVQALDPNATITFQVKPGQHSAYACLAGTTDTCGETSQLDWTESGTHSIDTSPSCN